MIPTRLIELLLDPSNIICRHCGEDLFLEDGVWLPHDYDDVCHDGEATRRGHEPGPMLTPDDLVWQICDRCRGDGELGGYPGVYTSDDFAEDPDFAEDYMSFRRPCEDCKGSGKVQELSDAAYERVHGYIDDYYETEAIYRQERMMGA